MRMYCFKKLYHPEIFQGKYKKRHYFEGWYYKLIDKSRKHAIAIIPGVSMGRDRKDSHAFIQVLHNGSQVSYTRFDRKDFKYRTDKFAVRIGNHKFTGASLSLKPGGKGLPVEGELKFRHIRRLPKSLLLPGIMGPFTYVPFMECHHGIVNIHHEITGVLKIAGKTIDFTGGYGYIEKDWGTSFPKTWIWFQSNHFGKKDATIMLSVARIPWLGSSFPGFISFFRLGDKLRVFSTYTHAKLKRLDYHHGILTAVIEDRKYRLELKVLRGGGGELKAPVKGMMDRTILESINSEVEIRLLDRFGRLLFAGTGTNAGLEIVQSNQYRILRD